MLDPKLFLLTECENVSRLLSNTLRYAYSSASSAEVYGECLARLRIIRSRIRGARAEDTDRLNELSIHLSKLSQLIGRVERSHIEEFSWPFAAALEDLARRVCSTEQGDATPLFFISADDELFSYQIRTEEDDPGLMERPLFNIIFPRSLKHFALLHPILGHEVGHAAYAIPSLGAALESSVTRILVSGSALDDFTKFAEWAAASGTDLDADESTQAVLSWPEEFYCDLFGLLLMGPSYIGANHTLLLGLQDLSDTHPGSLTRCWAIAHAIDVMGWSSIDCDPESRLGRAVAAFFGKLRATAEAVPDNLRLLKPANVRQATVALADILRKKGVLFETPNADLLERLTESLLRGCPPVATTVTESLEIFNERVDFRTILYAGWLAWSNKQSAVSDLSFLDINMLCDRGLLQQNAVDHFATWAERA